MYDRRVLTTNRALLRASQKGRKKNEEISHTHTAVALSLHDHRDGPDVNNLNLDGHETDQTRSCLPRHERPDQPSPGDSQVPRVLRWGADRKARRSDS